MCQPNKEKAKACIFPSLPPSEQLNFQQLKLAYTSTWWVAIMAKTIFFAIMHQPLDHGTESKPTFVTCPVLDQFISCTHIFIQGWHQTVYKKSNSRRRWSSTSNSWAIARQEQPALPCLCSHETVAPTVKWNLTKHNSSVLYHALRGSWKVTKYWDASMVHFKHTSSWQLTCMRHREIVLRH